MRLPEGTTPLRCISTMKNARIRSIRPWWLLDVASFGTYFEHARAHWVTFFNRRKPGVGWPRYF